VAGIQVSEEQAGQTPRHVLNRVYPHVSVVPFCGYLEVSVVFIVLAAYM
jgi:hypothetical protein